MYYTAYVKTQYTEDDLQHVEHGKKALYVIVVVRYKDSPMSDQEEGVTEFCGMFSGSFSIWKRCGNNRIYRRALK